MRSRRGLFVVADGIGARGPGRVAARMAMGCVCEAVENPREEWSPGCPAPAPEPSSGLLEEAIQLANRRLMLTVTENPRLTGMAASLVGALFLPGRIAIAHVGDCRAYRLREHGLEQLTHDHTLLNDCIRAGLIRPEDDDPLPGPALLTRALGLESDLKVDLYTGRPAPEDVYLLCSNGLSGVVAASELEVILRLERNLRRAAWRLVQRARQLDGPNNITLVLVRVLGSGDGSHGGESGNPTIDPLR